MAVCSTPERRCRLVKKKPTFEPHNTARLTATAWRWPPDRKETGRRTEGRLTAQFLEHLEGFGFHPVFVKRAHEPGQIRADFPAKEQVCNHVEVLAQGQILIDGRNAEIAGIVRRIDRDARAFEEELAFIHAVGAGHDLGQGRLAGAVVANQGDDLSGT